VVVSQWQDWILQYCHALGRGDIVVGSDHFKEMIETLDRHHHTTRIEMYLARALDRSTFNIALELHSRNRLGVLRLVHDLRELEDKFGAGALNDAIDEIDRTHYSKMTPLEAALYRLRSEYGAPMFNSVAGKQTIVPQAAPSRTLRCSSLDSLVKCPPSVLAQLPRQKPGNDAADLGTAVHTALAMYVKHHHLEPYKGTEDWAEDVDELVHAGAQAWDQLSRVFHLASPEMPVHAKASGFTLEGTADVLGLVKGDENKPAIVDWKTGFVDHGHKFQMRGYALCVWDMCSRPEEMEVLTATVYLRTGQIEYARHKPTDLLAFEREVTRNVLPKYQTFSPGEHCINCECYVSCTARKSATNDTITSILNGTGEFDKYAKLLQQVTRENRNLPEMAEAVRELRFRTKLLEQVTSAANKVLREAVINHGPLPTSAETHLVVEERTKKVVDPQRALPALGAILSPEQINSAMTLSVPKLVAACAQGYDKNDKKSARLQVLQALEKVEAVHDARYTVLTERPIRKEATDDSGTDQT
jgi:hypothetical protein